MGLEKNPAGRRQHVLDFPADDIGFADPQPRQKRAIDPDDAQPAVQRHIAAWSMIVEIVERFPREADRRGAAQTLEAPQLSRNWRIASMVSAGALMCGQWPVAAMICNCAFGIRAAT